MKRAMNEHAPQGTRVRFAFPENGSEFARRKAAQFLKPGNVYTVERTHLFSNGTDVWFQELPGISFDSRMFEEVDPQPVVNGHSNPS